MNVTSCDSRNKTEFGLGEPFDTRALLLIAYQNAREQLQRAQVEGSRNEVLEASWAATEALGDLDKHERDVADAWLAGMRWATRNYGTDVSGILSETSVISKLSEQVENLEEAFLELARLVAGKGGCA